MPLRGIRAFRTLGQKKKGIRAKGYNHACAKHKIKGFALAWSPFGGQSCALRMHACAKHKKKGEALACKRYALYHPCAEHKIVTFVMTMHAQSAWKRAYPLHGPASADNHLCAKHKKEGEKKKALFWSPLWYCFFLTLFLFLRIQNKNKGEKGLCPLLVTDALMPLRGIRQRVTIMHALCAWSRASPLHGTPKGYNIALFFALFLVVQSDLEIT